MSGVVVGAEGADRLEGVRGRRGGGLGRGDLREGEHGLVGEVYFSGSKQSICKAWVSWDRKYD